MRGEVRILTPPTSIYFDQLTKEFKQSMKAFSFSAPYQTTFVEVDAPQLGAQDVLIDVRYVGLCGTDLSTYRGLNPLVSYPRIPGHEVSGVIVEKGDRVPELFQVGDRVMVSPYTECGLCPACRQGRVNTCQYNQTYGVQRHGVMTGRFAVHYNKVFVTNALSLEEAVLVEPLSVGYHAANRGRVCETDTVLVLGSGTIGIGVIAAAARKGARVVAVDVDERKLQMARKFGAGETIHSKRQDVVATVKELTNGEGVNVAIEAIGLPQTYRQAIEAAAFGGRVVYIGYAKEEIAFNTADFVRKELDILGSRNALRVFPSVIDMLKQRERPFAEMISRIYPFAETGNAFADWHAAPGEVTKLLVTGFAESD